MPYFYLLTGGLYISLVHFYLVWHHRDNRKYSLSEHAIITTRSHIIYFASHVICEIFFFLYSYQFYIIDHHLLMPFWLNMSFILFDFTEALLPSRGNTEKVHFAAAYISWICYLLSGLIALGQLHVVEPYKLLAIALLFPILGMFVYMHINHSKLYPYQLSIVPLYVFYLLFITIGAP